MTVVPQVVCSLAISTSHRYSKTTQVLLRIILTALAFVNLHQLSLIYTCLGRFFQSPDIETVKRWKGTKAIRQTIFSATLITLLFVVNINGDPLRVLALILAFLYPFLNLCFLAATN